MLVSNDSSARGRVREKKHSLVATLYVDSVIIFALRTPTTNVVD